MLCIQTPPKWSGVDSKPICHLDPLLPRFIYVAWLFDSYSFLCNMVHMVCNMIKKGLKREYFQWKETFCSTFAEFQFKWFCQFLYQDEQSSPWSLVTDNVAIIRETAKCNEPFFSSLESSGKALFQIENFYRKIHLRDMKIWIQRTLVHQLSCKTPFMMTLTLIKAWKGICLRVSDCQTLYFLLVPIY